MLKITELQKFMFIYKEIKKYGEKVEKGNWGFDVFELNGIKILGNTDNQLGMLIISNDLSVACNQNSQVEMFTYYIGNEGNLDNLVEYFENMKKDVDKVKIN